MKNRMRLASLRCLLRDMEHEVGLDDLSPTQRDIYYAACLLAERDPSLASEDLKSHPLVADMARPTFYRALRDLVENHYLGHAPGTKVGKYLVLK
jgi:hypothetical protein